jgi:hypothetical protein
MLVNQGCNSGWVALTAPCVTIVAAELLAKDGGMVNCTYE